MTTSRTLFLNTLKKANTLRPPVWMMRQAGRYHAHYQNIRKKYSFEQICKTPDVAADVAMGPMDDFDFDVAILFSDILFPLEVLGMPLSFNPGPKLEGLIKTTDDLKRLTDSPAIGKLNFQNEALHKTRARLGVHKGLIGFVGSPLTLYVFAVEGTHKQGVESALQGFTDGRFDGFMDKVSDLLVANMGLQAEANPDAIAMFDSSAGDISFDLFKTKYFPHLKRVLQNFKARYRHMPIIYYGKNIGAKQWELLKTLPIDCLGIDHHQSMPTTMKEYAGDFALQGNLDPDILTLDPQAAAEKIEAYLSDIKKLDADLRRGWVLGLGHGITPTAKEENVKTFVKLSREIFGGG